MGFDIRAIFSRSLGGRNERDSAAAPGAAPDEARDEDGDDPESPIGAAAAAAVDPETDDMAQGGASLATAFIPEGLAAMPSAAVDDTASGRDEIDPEQSLLLAEVAVAATLVEGATDADERDDLLESLREIPGIEDLTPDDLAPIIARLAPDEDDFVARFEDRLEEIRASLTDPVLRRAAYQLAAYFCAWDGQLSDGEVDLLESVASAFEISDDEAAQLREATLQDAGMEAWEEAAAAVASEAQARPAWSPKA